MKFSVLIPAHDEEQYLGACLRSIEEAARPFPGQVETIVVLNRCTDDTEKIAHEHSARVVRDDSKNLAKIRNAGAAEARGEILITLDADSTMSANLLTEVDRALASGKVIGGGVHMWLDRYSIGLALTVLAMLPVILLLGISGGSLWCRRSDFDEIGGFDEDRLSFEDVDFARRLKAHGKRQGKRFKTLIRAHIVTSTRKFDQMGDWYLLLHPWIFFRMLRGCDRALADKLWYEVER
jgi:glycosyltransferase involved in cell wall biosynthesis